MQSDLIKIVLINNFNNRCKVSLFKLNDRYIKYDFEILDISETSHSF